MDSLGSIELEIRHQMGTECLVSWKALDFFRLPNSNQEWPKTWNTCKFSPYPDSKSNLPK